MLEVKICEDQSEWDDYVLDHHGHPMQLWSWGEFKSSHAWQVERLFFTGKDGVVGAAQVFTRKVPGVNKHSAYVPRGPVVGEDDREAVLEALSDYEKNRSIVLIVEPEWVDYEFPKEWKKSRNTILVDRTLILDLTKSEDELLADMSKKTRQYVRKSAKEQITIRKVTDRVEIEKCMEIYEATAARAGFGIHPTDYYVDLHVKMHDHAPLFAAFIDDEPVAFLWLAISEYTAFELYGGVSEAGQSLRANFALKWHAIQTMKKWGISRYDMNGLLNDGISKFKQGFASHEDQLVGTYDRPLSPLYFVWNWGLPLGKRMYRLAKKLRK